MIDENEGSEASLVGEFGVCPEPMSAFAQELAAWSRRHGPRCQEGDQAVSLAAA